MLSRPDRLAGPVAVFLALGALLTTVYLVRGGDIGVSAPAALLAFGALVAVVVAWVRAQRRAQDAERRRSDLEHRYERVIDAFAVAIDARDPAVRGHARGVQGLAEAMGRLVAARPERFGSDELLDSAWLESLSVAALLHDVGKLALPDHVLLRGGVDLPSQSDKLREHAVLGARIIDTLASACPLGPLVRHHHERWDGTGYPDRLQGEAIPLGARIIGLADHLDRLRRMAAHRGPEAVRQLVAFVAREAGRSIDPRLAELFCEHAAALLGEEPPVEVTAARDDVASRNETDVAVEVGTAQREAGLVYELSRALSGSLELDELAGLIGNRLLSLMSASSCVLYLPDDSGERLIPRHALGPLSALLSKRSFRCGEGITGWVHDTGECALNSDPRVDLGALPLDAPGVPRSAAAFPIRDGDAGVGVVVLYASQPGAFTEDHRRIFETVSPQVAGALRNALLFKETLDTSMTDSLTGLPNSRYLYTQLDREMSRATRNGTLLGVVVMDLDGFKSINDRHGHQAGDQVLRDVARLLRETFRVCDHVCRYAGDEFVALLPDTSPSGARTLVRRVQQQIDEHPLVLRDGTQVRIGLSAGCSCFPIDGGGLEELIHRADKEMYRDKAGRHARWAELAATAAAPPASDEAVAVRDGHAPAPVVPPRTPADH
jgi:diguanylate cyclase (GGDEF)-like protein